MEVFIHDNLPKLEQTAFGIGIFFLIIAGLFFLASKAKGRAQRPLALAIFFGPAAVLLIVGLIIPAIQTILFSFEDANSKSFVGLKNYLWIITNPEIHIVLRNTLLWIVLAPLVTAGLGLLLAIMLDRMKHESIAKSLIFMPMAISFVGASIIWKFVYQYAPPKQPQIGLLSTIVRAFGFEPSNWILITPLNSFLLMVIFVWVQTGFGMVILSAAIKGVPTDIIEASTLDGASGWRLFRGITFPMVKGTFIVVFATTVVTSLKLFDIVRTMTGGNFGTNVLSNEMYAQVFVQFDQGRGSALAVVLFLALMPVLLYNIRSLKEARKIS